MKKPPAPAPGDEIPGQRDTTTDSAHQDASLQAERILDHDQPLNAVAGVLTGKVIRDLTRPLQQLRDDMASMLEAIERHFGAADGPDPYPWNALQSLRQELAEAYLQSRETARLITELTAVLGAAGTDDKPALIEVNPQVEAAIALVRSRFAEHTELFIDLGSTPPIRAVPGQLALLIAKLLMCCADSAAALQGSAVSVHTRYYRKSGHGSVVMTIADNGRGLPGAVESVKRTALPLVASWGAGFEGVCRLEQGSAFECTFPVPAPNANRDSRGH